MIELFAKVTKWFFFTGCFVLGVGWMWEAAQENIRWAFPALMAFSVVYLLSNVWTEMPKKTMFITVFLGGILGVTAKFLPMIVYLLTDNVIEQNMIIYWIMLLGVVGTPIMALVFKVLD